MICKYFFLLLSLSTIGSVKAMYKVDLKNLEYCLNLPPVKKWTQYQPCIFTASERGLLQKIHNTPGLITEADAPEIAALEKKIAVVLKDILKTVPKL